MSLLHAKMEFCECTCTFIAMFDQALGKEDMKYISYPKFYEYIRLLAGPTHSN